jgi:hypothetical protein
LNDDFPPKGEVKSWARWLGRESDPKKIERIKQALTSGKPCGDERFIKRMEKRFGRSFRSRNPGRPRKREN